MLPDAVPPFTILEIPLYRLEESRLEAFLWRPTQFAIDFRSIDRVPMVVAGPISHKLDQRTTRFVLGRQNLIDPIADLLHHAQIGLLAAATNIIGLADFSLEAHLDQR